MPLYARQQALKTVTGVSPTGGINSVAALSSMQPDECVQMENLWPGAGGAQSRLGSTVHTENVGYTYATSTFTPPTTATATCVINAVSFTATFSVNADTTVNNLITLIQANVPTNALVTVTLVAHKMLVTAKALGTGGNGITTTSNAANGASFSAATTTGGLSSSLGNYTLIPFHGEDGTKNKLFVATNEGIFDCSVTGAVPILSIAFATKTGLAGTGSTTNYSSIGDHFCIYCDEVNGYYLYSESTQTLAARHLGRGQHQRLYPTHHRLGDLRHRRRDVQRHLYQQRQRHHRRPHGGHPGGRDDVGHRLRRLQRHHHDGAGRGARDGWQRHHHHHRRCQRSQLLRGSDDRRGGWRLRRQPQRLRLPVRLDAAALVLRARELQRLVSSL